MLCASIGTNHSSIIHLSFRPYPAFKQTAAGLIQAPHTQLAGIITSYAGYTNASDVDGSVTFPRLQLSPRLHLVVTPHIVPVVMFANTIHHLEFDPEAPAFMVTAEQKHDAETDLTYWSLTEDTIPEDNIIPLDSVIIIVNPDELSIPLGVIPTTDSPHLILPDIYIKSTKGLLSHALYMLNLTMFFSSLQNSAKLYKPQKAMQIITHP